MSPKQILKRFLQLPADALIASSKKLPNRILQFAHKSVYLSDGFYPYKPDQPSYLLRSPSAQNLERAGDSQLPVPPQDLRMGYDNFLSSGKTNVATMKGILESSGFRIKEGNRVLDFGCAAGRMIRWFDDIAEQCEIWGVDVSAEHIIWCQQHLAPPFYFSNVTTAPHLPFEDGYFDLIYAGSVFTHIADLADAWFLELKRITRPGGRLYITVHDQHTIDLVRNRPSEWAALKDYYKKENIGERDFDMFTINRTRGTVNEKNMAQVFYNIDYLRRHWGRFMKILSITEEAYYSQTAIVFEKTVALAASHSVPSRPAKSKSIKEFAPAQIT
jgi:ubiquinone/menaquinone biosynthesis C-methylase UbiE